MSIDQDYLAAVLWHRKLPFGGLAGLHISLDANAAHAAAELILAAGYRRPYQISTHEALDALPNHSVIVDNDADIWQKRGDEWCSYETNPHIGARLLKYAPLTVIHEGVTP